MGTPRHVFARFATKVSEWAGKPVIFVLALVAVVIWAVLGPVFDYSETWQLVINTGTDTGTSRMFSVRRCAVTVTVSSWPACACCASADWAMAAPAGTSALSASTALQVREKRFCILDILIIHIPVWVVLG